jgi:glycosyltransferase involved in cell wall biosynthesis
MKVLFVMNGVSYGFSRKPSISGGDVITIEIAKRWARKGVLIYFLTSLAGKNLCERLGLNATYYLSSRSSNSSIWNYIFLVLKIAIGGSPFSERTSAKANFDFVYSTCEHLYDVLPALKIRKRNVKWVATVHFVPPSPLTRVKAGWLNAFLYYLNHMLGAQIIRSRADLVFAVSQRTVLDYVHKLKFDQNKVATVPGGIDYDLIRTIANSYHEMQYDAIYMKRLQPMKGVFDVIKIWRLVVIANPTAKLLIVGDGPVEVVKQMHYMITKFGLTGNIEIRGPVYDVKEKISLLAESKLFLLPSYEENWAIVIGEALTAGLPVIVYDLPEIRSLWGEHVIWTPKGDVRSFAEEVVKLLSSHQYYQINAGKGINFTKQFDWDKIAQKELELCTQLTTSK